MTIFELTTESRVPAPIERVFAFFSQAENLERLTPPFLDFRILTPTPVAMRKGTTIDYRISLHGLPLTWRSAITRWDPPHGFVDEQVRGPYRSWKHTHGFAASDAGTLVSDRVEYSTWGGAIVNALLVAPDLRRIFEYRQTALRAHFGASGAFEPSVVAVRRRS